MTTKPTHARYDLSDYTLAELKGLLFDVGNAIREGERRQLQDARARVAEIARGAGLSMDKLVDADEDANEP